ncbi:MAG: hypothetical protein WC364_12015, partial [Eubacteriales bacterium]
MEISKSFRPLRGLVLIRRDKPEEEIGGIIIPKLYQQYGWCAEVVSTGDNVKNYKKGDRIMFRKEHCVLPFSDRNMAITADDKILARLVVDGNVEQIIPQGNHVLVEN